MAATEVDVVIPAFNPGPYLRIALESVLTQTLETWSATVIDDGSSEDLSWVDALDPRIVRVRQANAGVSAALNRGIAEGSAKYVAFLDQDDVWRPGKLAAQRAALEHRPSVGLCSTAFEIVGPSGERISGGFEGYAGSYQELLTGNGIGASTTMVPRLVLEKIGLFDPTLVQVQDWDLWLRIARSYEIIRLDDVLAEWRLHADNFSGDYLRLLTYGGRVLGAHEALGEASGRPSDANAARLGQRRLRQLAGVQAFDNCRASLRSNPVSAVRHLYHAVRLAPAYTAGATLRKLGSVAGRRRDLDS